MENFGGSGNAGSAGGTISGDIGANFTGFIAGGALMGVVSALLRFAGFDFINQAWLDNPLSQGLSLIAYGALIYCLVRFTKK